VEPGLVRSSHSITPVEVRHVDVDEFIDWAGAIVALVALSGLAVWFALMLDQ